MSRASEASLFFVCVFSRKKYSRYREGVLLGVRKIAQALCLKGLSEAIITVQFLKCDRHRARTRVVTDSVDAPK